jgi:hypothetical protein
MFVPWITTLIVRHMGFYCYPLPCRALFDSSYCK